MRTRFLLLPYRLTTDAVVRERVGDSHSLQNIAELVKCFLYRTLHDAQQDAASVAMLCASHSATARFCFSTALRIRLLQWLQHRACVDIAKLRTRDGDTILHEAVRNGDAWLVIWLSANYRSLNYTMGETSWQDASASGKQSCR